MLRISASLAAALLATTALPAPAEAQSARHRHATSRPDHEPDAVTYGRRDDVLRFAAEIAEREGLDREALERALAQARYQPAVARLIMPPRAGSAKNWAAYRGRFVEPDRVRAGASFWQANAAWLAEAESRYGVPADIVVGIVGVETFYGRVMGDFRILDALAHTHLRLPHRSQGPQPVLPRRAGAVPQAHPARPHRPALGERLLRRRDGPAAVHARQPDEARRRLRRRRPHRPRRQRRRRDRQRGRLPRRLRLEARPAHPLRDRRAGGRGRPRRAAGAPTSCPASRRRNWPSAARNWPRPAARTTARWRWWNCRTAPRRRAMWRARKTSTRSRATTGRATTRWR